MLEKYDARNTGLSLFAIAAALSALLAGWVATPAQAREPSLIITSEPLPESLRDQVYSKPVRIRDIKPSDLSVQPARGISRGDSGTIVSGKIREIAGEVSAIQNKVGSFSSDFNALQQENGRRAADYYASVATVNTQLQSGTTPGNPRLVQKISLAETSLEGLGSSVARMNGLAVDLANTASEASYLLETVRAAYSLSGAVEEDHVELARMEDQINSLTVVIDRLLNNINDDITRTSTYLSSERNNLRTLSLAVTNGDLYGKSLANRPFSGASHPFSAENASYTSGPSSAADAPRSLPGGARPLVKIRFDRPDVDYEQPVYMAVNEALDRYPDARFDLVAVTPTSGNAAEVAIESTRARRNAERVLRTLTQMGLPLERIDLSYSDSAEASTSEVHLYIR